MKKSIKNLFIIEIFMIIAIFFNFFISNVFNNYIYFLFLFTILFVLIKIFGIDLKPSIKQKSTLVSMLIVILLYFLITYLSGIFIGFNRTIYSFNLNNFINNIIPVLCIIVSTELIRYQLIKKSNNDKLIVIFSIILFILFEISINFKLYNFSTPDQIYEFIGMIIFASISKNIFMTIQCIYTDYINNIIYRVIMELYIFLVPIVPALGPYVNSILLIIIPVILCFVVYSNIKIKILDKPNARKSTNAIYYIALFILIVLFCLNSGFFKYQTLTIGSNSMQPYISKGDVIIVKKMNSDEKNKIKKGDLLVFKYDKKIISHRVYQVLKRDDGIYFRTKGDNNDQVDSTIIDTKSVIGVSNIRIKYIGIPSVLLQELFK